MFARAARPLLPDKRSINEVDFSSWDRLLGGPEGKMRRAALAAVVVYSVLLSSLSFAQTPKPVDTVPVSQIHAGMRGVAYTVFQGTTPEPMEVEVLGVLRNANGPKGDVIMVRLGGAKAEYTGVVAGMSGSPVYFNGKLAGAVAFRIGEFSKEPIAGVTPISEMLEISALDSTPTNVPVQVKSVPSLAAKTSGPGLPSTTEQSFANYLRPIDTPLVFSGFSEDAVQRFAPQFGAQGIVPVMGVGSASDVKQPEPLVPGSAVSAVLVRGDMDIAATCTVTYIDATHLLACGHPLMQFGMVDLPMTKAQVLATLPSPLNAFKIVNATETVGSFVQDRHNGILGELGKQAEMIPVTLTIHGGTAPKQFHYEVLNNARLSPVAISTTVFNALHGVNEYGDETTYTMKGAISVGGFPEVKLQDMYSTADGGQPAAMLAASSIGGAFGRITITPIARRTSGVCSWILKSLRNATGPSSKAPAPMSTKHARGTRLRSRCCFGRIVATRLSNTFLYISHPRLRRVRRYIFW